MPAVAVRQVNQARSAGCIGEHVDRVTVCVGDVVDATGVLPRVALCDQVGLELGAVRLFVGLHLGEVEVGVVDRGCRDFGRARIDFHEGLLSCFDGPDVRRFDGIGK